jgi:hypothetical protein
MSVFTNKIFNKMEFNDDSLNSEREELLKGSSFTKEDVINWFIETDKKDSSSLIDQLYYSFRTKQITDVVGLSVKSDKYGIGGVYIDEFYTKLYDGLSKWGRSLIFSFLPGSVQTDEMLIAYIQNPGSGSGSINTYKGKKLKTSTLEWLIDNALVTIKDWKEGWWTPKLKTRVLAKEPFAITLLPKDLITKAEFRNYLEEHGEKNKRYMTQFWKNTPEEFKMDPEIFGRWLALAGGLRDNYSDIYSKDFYTLEGIKKYFEFMDKGYNSDWSIIKSEWKEDLIDDVLPKIAGPVALDKEIELTNSLLKKILLLSKHIVYRLRVKIALRLVNEGRLTQEVFDDLHISYLDIEATLENKDLELLMSNDIVLTTMLKKLDMMFLKRKSNWPKKVKMKREHVIDLILAFQYDVKKVNQRINRRFEEDDFIWIYLEANKLTSYKRIHIQGFLEELVDTSILMNASSDTISLLKKMPKEMGYEGFKEAREVFIF